MTPKKPQIPNYQPKIIEEYRKGNIPPGMVTHSDIYHDKWCAIFKGGACNCDPEIVHRRNQ